MLEGDNLNPSTYIPIIMLWIIIFIMFCNYRSAIAKKIVKKNKKGKKKIYCFGLKHRQYKSFWRNTYGTEKVR